KQDMRLVSATNHFALDYSDPKTKDDVVTLNEIHVPFAKNADGAVRPVIIYITSKAVIHSFKLIALRITQDAIPGMRIPVWFRPTQEGRFQINCAQLCGNGHSTMAGGYLIVESEEAFKKWLGTKTPGSQTSFE